MSKKICVIGTGYVGLIAAVGLSDFGNEVVGVDLDEKKINLLKKGLLPIYEPGIEEYLHRNLESKRLSFSIDVETGIRESDVIFIAVGTPEKKNQEADLSYIYSVVDMISRNLNSYKVIVTKSTVPVGTNRSIKEYLERIVGHKNFDIVSNPEFLREGKAAQDFFHPDRTVIGYESDRAKEIMFEVYRPLNIISVPFVWCSLETAELIKYASNAFLATKITYINEIANLAEAVGADVHEVAKSMGMDGRISPKFLHPGPGYGGSCFPKDTKAIVSFGKQFGVEMDLIDTVIKSNEKQKLRMLDKVVKMIGDIANKNIAVLGLAFKQETDDIRESPSITLVEQILAHGGIVKAHDPKAIDNFSKLFPQVSYYSNAYDAIEDADVVLLLTEWNEYRALDLTKLKKLMRTPCLIDTRNLLEPSVVKKHGFEYDGVGRK